MEEIITKETLTSIDLFTVAQQFGRWVVLVPEHGQILVYDKGLIGDGFVRQFPYEDDGFRRACRWAVNLNEADEDSVTKPFVTLVEEYRHKMKGA